MSQSAAPTCPACQQSEIEYRKWIPYERRSSNPAAARFPVLTAALALTPLVFLINGYHPYADDGAIYVAEILRLAHPALYPHDSAFVLAPSHDSIFGHVLAAFLAHTHVSLGVTLLACQLGSTFLFLLACGRIAEKLFDKRSARWGALAAGACCFTLPVAGTALFVMDPYVTARSFSTPLSLFAVAACLDGSPKRALFWLVLAALIHPLMAAYAAVFLLMLELAIRASGRRQIAWMSCFALSGLPVSAAIFMATLGVSPSLASSRADLSRSYFFLSSWNWYEYPGLVFPLLLLGVGAWRKRGGDRTGELAATAFAVGLTAVLVSLCFVHQSGSFLLARLQPLRSFHIIYVAGILLAGGWIGNRLERFRRWRLLTALALCAGVSLLMFRAQRITYASSNPIEWPWLQPRNAWERAFVWIRTHTPQDAVFALDADYIEYPGEDSQGFRAIAERSMLADWYKDGGIASEFPPAQHQWEREVRATEGLNRATDAQRLARLLPLGASWVVLPMQAETRLVCEYKNSAVRVCRLPSR